MSKSLFLVGLLTLLPVAAQTPVPPPPPPPPPAGAAGVTTVFVTGPGGVAMPPGSPVAESKPEDRCAVEGKVVNAATGEPLRKANLTMRRADVAMNTTGIPTSYTTSTDDGGQFSMKDIEPGRYRLMVDRTGFVRSEYGARGPTRQGATLMLAPKQKLSGIDFKLTPHAVIAGRVVDVDGEPVAGVQVSTMSWRYTQGRRQLMPQNAASTNDLGEFRVYGLAPGKYYLSANANRMGDMTAVDSSARQGPEEGYVPTYYPGTTDPASAAQVEVIAGQQLLGMEMRLSKARTVRVRGRMNNPINEPGRPTMLMLLPKGGFQSFALMNRTIASGADGRFEFRGVAPGSYVLTGSVMDGRTPNTARMPIEVGDRNVENVVLNIGSGFEVRAEVKVEGGTPNAVNLAAMMLSLGPADPGQIMFGGQSSDRVTADGSVTLTNVSPDRYRVMLRPIPDGYYIKSIRMGEQDGLENGIDLSAGAGGVVRVVLAAGAATVDGAVANDKQEPAPGVTVVLLPEKVALRENWQYTKTATTDQYGRFSFRGVDPGEYRAYAWDDIEQGAWLDPDFIKLHESKGKRVKLQEAGKETLDLKVIRVE